MTTRNLFRPLFKTGTKQSEGFILASYHSRTPFTTSRFILPSRVGLQQRFYSDKPKKLSLFQRQVQTFKSKPGSYLTSFLILHEVTAIAPLPVIYYTLSWLEWNVMELDPTGYIKEGNEFIARIRKNYPFIGHGWGITQVTYGAVAYAIVKALLPFRIMFSVWATPWMANRVIAPIVRIFRRGKKPTPSPPSSPPSPPPST